MHPYFQKFLSFFLTALALAGLVSCGKSTSVHLDSQMSLAGLLNISDSNPVIIDNGKAGYSEIGSGWKNSDFGGYGGTSRFHVAGKGAEKAIWRFSGLSDGTYGIAVTWKARPARATNAKYQILDGTVLIKSVTFDQQKEPTGLQLKSYPFQKMGAVAVTKGVLSIELEDAADADVSADAVALFSFTPFPSPTPNASPTPTATVTPTATPAVTPTPSATPTGTPALSPTPTVTPPLIPTPTVTPTPTPTPSPQASLPWKPGFILRGGSGELSRYFTNFQKHPLTPYVILESGWSDIETGDGIYSTQKLEGTVNQWCGAGYGVILNIFAYGQSPGTQLTSDGYHYVNGFPMYLYNALAKVPNSLVKYTPNLNPVPVAVPVVYSDPIVLQRYSRMMRKLAGLYDGNPCISFVVLSAGHIGHLNVGVPTGWGAALQSGIFTNQKWVQYVLSLESAVASAFTKTPLIAIAEKGYFGNNTSTGTEEPLSYLMGQLAGLGVHVINTKMETLNTLDPKFPTNTDASTFLNSLAGALPFAAKSGMRLGMGADWPLWVPAYRLNSTGTTGHDYAFACGVLNSLLNYVPGYGKFPVTLMMGNPPDIMASNPYNPATATDPNTGVVAYDPILYKIYDNAYTQMLLNNQQLEKGTFNAQDQTKVPDMCK